ncbi:MAG: DUF423 domain-containing protein [Desulfuromonadales bacterium]|jgi:uncharacterized membrane protein YgdD (TMEM256/DUF423 family)
MIATTKIFAFLGGLAAALAVALGAFGAHALKARLEPQLLITFETGVRYHFYHALGLFAVAFAATLLPDSPLVRWAGWLMMAGIVLFSGSLYVIALGGARSLGAVTPLGGVAFILAWLLLAAATARG